jgi:microcystin-dependent protein
MNPHPPQALIKKGGWASRLPLFLVFLVFSFALPASIYAQTAPTLIPFQARLTNQLGEAYSSGQYTLTFNLYDQAVGGSTVWTERHEKVGIVNGMVNVFLGSIATFPPWQPGSNPQVPLFTGTKYLGITVDADGNPATADPEMVPRTMLVNAFHAQNASNLAGFNWSEILQGGTNNPQTGFIRADKLNPASITNAQITPLTINTVSVADSAITLEKLAAAVKEAFVPPGTILPFGGTTAPSGFLFCDGAAYNRAGTYSTLFTAISTNFGAPSGTTFNVPDLRGQFLRGAMPNLTANGSGTVASNNVTLTLIAPATSHPFSRTGMRVKVTAGSLVGLTIGLDYFVINVSATQIAFASTQENALAGTKVSISGSASGFVVVQAEDPDAAGRLALAPGGAIGNLVGSFQADSFSRHSHQMTNAVYDAGGAYGGSVASGGNYGFAWPGFGGAPIQNTTAVGSSETRPKNASVNYIIKY